MNFNLDYKITYFKKNYIMSDSNDTQYREDIIHFFNLKDMFNEKIDDRVFFKILSDNAYQIYLKYKHNSQILILLKKIKDNLKMPFELTDDALFMYLFRFDLFHLFHKCLLDLNKDNNISEPNFQLLMNSI
jgi:hypothetical protein